LRLPLASPAIDDGNNAAAPAGFSTDRQGYQRFIHIACVTDGTIPIRGENHEH